MRRWFLGKLGIALVTALACACALVPVGPSVQGEVIIEAAPPPTQVEAIPVAPYPGGVWIEGYWHWNGVRYVWYGGHYERPRPGWVWVAHRWYRGPRGRWHFVRGHWQPVR